MRAVKFVVRPGKSLASYTSARARRRLTLLRLEQLEDRRLLAVPVLVKDIETLPGYSNPSGFVDRLGVAYFAADDGLHGRELWRSDGTAAGTFLLRDIHPGGIGSYPGNLTDLNGTLYFTADDSVDLGGTLGRELWKSDGTPAGTVLVKDIFPGMMNQFEPNGSHPSELTVVGTTLYFTAENGTNGRELWKTNGTSNGTVLVKDIFPGSTFNWPNSSTPYDLTNVNGTLFFTADNGTNGRELWKSNGTAAGTVLVKDIRPGAAGSLLDNLTDVNGTLFFVADDGTNGVALWKSNGTAAGTVLVRQITSAPLGQFVQPFTLVNVNGTLSFTVDDGTSNLELWTSDGTTAGTIRVKEIAAGGTPPRPSQLMHIGGRLYFSAKEAATGQEIWTSDGTTAGTVLLRDIHPGPADSEPYELRNVAGTLFFVAHDTARNHELWTSDGSTAGTTLAVDLFPGSVDGSYPSGLTDLNGTLYFAGDDGVHGKELWKLPPPSDTTAPTASVTSPTTGQTVSGSVAVTALAADNVAVTRVEFYVGTTLIGTDTTSNAGSFSVSWDTTGVVNGSYALTARAFGAAGNTATSAAVTVTVSNAPPSQNDLGTGADAPNDPASAVALAAPREGTGRLAPATDTQDWYRVAASAGQTLRVEMTPPSGADFTLEVRTPDGRVFRSPQPAGRTERLEITMPSGFNGDFVIGVILEDGSPGGDYQMKLELR